MIAYVLLQVAPGKVGPVVTWLRKLEGVAEAYAIYGEHDVIGKVEVADSQRLDSLIMETVQANPDVIATATLITMEAYPRVRRRRAVGRPRRRARLTPAAEAPKRGRRARQVAAKASAEAPRRKRRARRVTEAALVAEAAPAPTAPAEVPPPAPSA